MTEPHIFAEIYVNDVRRNADFFEKALHANVRYLQPDFAEVHIGSARLLLNQLGPDEVETNNVTASEDAPATLSAGLELGIWVEDLGKVYQNIADSDLISYTSEIKEQPSGLKDFRFMLPDGYYVRVITGAHHGAKALAAK